MSPGSDCNPVGENQKFQVGMAVSMTAEAALVTGMLINLANQCMLPSLHVYKIGTWMTKQAENLFSEPTCASMLV